MDILGKSHLHESLEAYVHGELLEGTEAYFCEALNKKVKYKTLMNLNKRKYIYKCWKVPALKRLCLKTPPLNLVLHLKRFEMDYHMMETYKINDRFEFPLELNIYPYTASGLMQNEGIIKYVMVQ